MITQKSKEFFRKFRFAKTISVLLTIILIDLIKIQDPNISSIRDLLTDFLYPVLWYLFYRSWIKRALLLNYYISIIVLNLQILINYQVCIHNLSDPYILIIRQIIYFLIIIGFILIFSLLMFNRLKYLSDIVEPSAKKAILIPLLFSIIFQFVIRLIIE